MTIQEEVLKTLKFPTLNDERIIDLTLKKVEKSINSIDCSAQDNAIWFREELKQKLRSKE